MAINKKMIASIIAGATMVSALSVGGTLALLSDRTSELKNTFTIGDVGITLTEPGFIGDNAKNIEPGDTITKDPIVTNTGKNPAYVRAKVVLDSDTVKLLKAGTLTINREDANNGKWSGWPANFDSVADGQGTTFYVYYDGILNINEVTQKIFNSVTLKDTYVEGSAPVGFNIDIMAEAIQTKNLGEGIDSSEKAFSSANIEKSNLKS